MRQPMKTGRTRGRVAGRAERSEYAPGRRSVGGEHLMKHDDAPTRDPRDVDLVAKRVREIQRGKRGAVRWGMSRHTAERALEAIRLEEPRAPYRQSSKARRRKRSKRLL